MESFIYESCNGVCNRNCGDDFECGLTFLKNQDDFIEIPEHTEDFFDIYKFKEYDELIKLTIYKEFDNTVK